MKAEDDSHNNHHSNGIDVSVRKKLEFSSPEFSETDMNTNDVELLDQEGELIPEDEEAAPNQGIPLPAPTSIITNGVPP